MKKAVFFVVLILLGNQASIIGMDEGVVLDPNKMGHYSKNQDTPYYSTQKECYCNVTRCCNSSWNCLAAVWYIMSYCCTACCSTKK